ncbi:MAG: L,D-transpeptidase [Ignavibacteria bacterium]|nr:L,D-transpeptidase [Ignavibacteria bacterium]
MDIPEQEQNNIENNIEPLDSISEDSTTASDTKKNFILFSTVIPLLFIVFLLLSFTNSSLLKDENKDSPDIFVETSTSDNIKNIGKVNILSDKDLSQGLKDTVYTNLDCWLELKVHEQMLYQHWRNGRVEKYPITSGNKYISKGVEARPGLFAIFYKNANHKSVQFNDAALYHFMTFNQGIGFHSLAGTGYYGSLGVRPVSHGCIRMKHEDARKLFNDCPMGTLVLAHNGYSSRTVGFAPKDFKNEKDYTKEEYKLMLAENLLNVLEGKYYKRERHYFVVDPKAIPVSGMYISYDRKIPEKQKLPKNTLRITSLTDRINVNTDELEIMDSSQAYNEFALNEFFVNADEIKTDNQNLISSSEDLVKKYFHNPIGILPYFPPTNKGPSYDDVGSDDSNVRETGTDEPSSTPESVPQTPSTPPGNDEGSNDE